ncbi:MAG: DUF72 domain-containing protein [Nitrospirae bacterium]|nr:DUF72 domain-containing protein [Nitrospirota bacterium]
MISRCYIGTSGWIYPHWQGVFYPPRLRNEEWLAYYAKRFPTVEINYTFYRLPEPKVFRTWARAVPTGFLFAAKVSRFVTHMKKLKDPEVFLARFLRAVKGLGPALGPLLFQLPPFWKADTGRLRDLLAYLKAQRIIRPVQAVFEFRHPSWLTAEVCQILVDHGAALCLSDWPDLCVEGPVTADFVYIRRHGPGALYASRYSRQQLRNDAERIQALLEAGKEVYVYFNNDAQGWAVANARELREMVEGLGGEK